MDENLSRQLAIDSYRFQINFEHVNCIVIVGMRGTGKSQLAHLLALEFERVDRNVLIYDEDFADLSSSISKLSALTQHHSEGNPVIIVTQFIHRTTEEFLLNADLIISAQIAKFDRGLGYYGPEAF